ncbi:MAG TPA: pseudouridine synthase [Tepiditoga sp.]|nr:pseudouridine synthase [Tepiditoga sp.]
MQKLQKIVQTIGISRRNSADKIKNGEVKVNGKVIDEPWAEISENSEIEVKDYKKFIYREDSIKYKYYLYNKPEDVLCSLKDQYGRKTISDVISEKNLENNLTYAGRLDYKTSGLIILTNDGEYINKLTHPSFVIDKTYQAVLKKPVTKDDVARLENGVVIEGKKTAKAKVKIIANTYQRIVLNITIHEGMKRQVRLMVREIGNHVISLKRIKFWKYTIDMVPKSGDIKDITDIVEGGEKI